MRIHSGYLLACLSGALLAAGCSAGGETVDDLQPIASASANPQSGPAPLEVTFTGLAESGDAPLTYLWDFGDGTQATDQRPTHTYGSEGSYTATFTVTDMDGDSDTASVAITVTAGGEALDAVAVATPTSGRAPLLVNFSGTAIGGAPPYSYAWAFGDGGTSTFASPTYTYQTAGTFTATLTVTDAASDSDMVSIAIDVSDREHVAASATATPNSGTAPLQVSLSCNGSGGTTPYTYAWDFDDGDTSTTKNPLHTYDTAGSYEASCTVTDSLGDSDDATVAITVGGANVPTVSAAASPNAGQAPLDVHFYSTVTGGDAPITYLWAFGDGTTATTANPTHTYTAGGTYVVHLSVADADDDTATDQLTINVSDDNVPSANITASPTSGIAPLEVTMSAAVAGGDAPLTYEWDFGDGATLADALGATHTYSTPGDYTLTFTVTDNDGDRVSDTEEISVGSNSEPVVLILADTYSGDAPLTVNFEGWVFGGDAPMTYWWTFGDGTTSTEQDPTHTFSSEGVYNVTFIATDDNGDSDADSVDIVVQTGLPNLEITSFTSSVVDGDVTYSVTVHNAGTTDVGSFWVDLFYDEADAPVPGSDYGDAYERVESLAAGASDTVTFTRNDVAPATYNSYAMVDSLSQISEADETDNVDGPEVVVVTGDAVTDELLNADFESVDWADPWLLYDDNADSGDDYWGDSLDEAHGGTWSAFCSDEGDATDGYDNDMNAYMETSLDLTNYTWIDFEAYVWYQLEDGYDYLYIEVDDGSGPETLRQYTGDSGGWSYVYLNLDAYAGQSDVWVTFRFESDFSNSLCSAGCAGAYVDDVLIEGTYFP